MKEFVPVLGVMLLLGLVATAILHILAAIF